MQIQTKFEHKNTIQYHQRHLVCLTSFTVGMHISLHAWVCTFPDDEFLLDAFRLWNVPRKRGFKDRSLASVILFFKM